MLNIDFTKALSIPMDTEKAVKKSSKRKRITKPSQQLSLGDYKRIEKLPDLVSIEFLDEYSETLDMVLLPYVTHGLITIGYASKYKEKVIENVFGNEHHLGLFHYLKDKNSENKSDKELVSYAEKLLVKGWHIRQEGNQYWMVNADFTRIIEMTGKAPLAKELSVLSFDESSAHIFLDDAVASKFAALARTLGQDADELAAQGNLDVLLARVTDEKFGGYIVNYNAWRRALRKQAKYATMTDGITPMELYEEGFRLDSKITYPVSKYASLTDGAKKYLVIPVLPEINPNHGFNNYMVASLASKMKSELLAPVKGVVTQEVTELKDLRHTFALMVEQWEGVFAGMTYEETAEAIQRIKAHVDSGAVASSYGRRLLESLAAIFVTESILLGNKESSITSIGIDSISGSIYSYNGLNYFSEEISSLTLPGGMEFSLGSLSGVVRMSLSGGASKVLSEMVKVLPKSFLSNLANYQVDASEYPQQFNSILNYFEKARELVLKEAAS